MEESDENGWVSITDSLNLNPNHWSNRQLENNYSLLEGGDIVHPQCNNIQMGEHADKELSHPGGMVGAQVLQPAVPVQDSKEPGQLASHLVHQVTPDRPEQIITSSTWGVVRKFYWAEKFSYRTANAPPITLTHRFKPLHPFYFPPSNSASSLLPLPLPTFPPYPSRLY